MKADKGIYLVLLCLGWGGVFTVFTILFLSTPSCFLLLLKTHRNIVYHVNRSAGHELGATVKTSWEVTKIAHRVMTI